MVTVYSLTELVGEEGNRGRTAQINSILFYLSSTKSKLFKVLSIIKKAQ